MENLTILYYSSNRERIEPKILRNILDNSNLPIVSVTQKPTNFGTNICVGEVGNSYINEYRQILIGLKEIKTPYFVSCESDFLYSKDYFEFEPKGDNIYRSNNVWICFKDGGYRKKTHSEGAQIAKTDFMIKFIESYLKDLPEWFNGRPPITEGWYETYSKHQKNLWRLPYTSFTTSPCVSFKTSEGVSKSTKTDPDEVFELPIWGEINNLRKEYDSIY